MTNLKENTVWKKKEFEIECSFSNFNLQQFTLALKKVKFAKSNDLSMTRDIVCKPVVWSAKSYLKSLVFSKIKCIT